ncbi:MAG: KDP operon transcriptional regulatory protein KdpE [bacterium ADurb.Bin429]|nr:MAG: KDP operon transcriptional regulatory protein KdpE [bacterium ADurb.Bin429]
MMPEQRKNILVIDDEVEMRRLLSFVLSANGYAVYCAGNGAEGLRCAADLSPDLVILDLLLPVMHGLDVCRALRAWYLRPILFLTVSTSERDLIAALDAGGDDYLTKPFSNGELLARVRALMRRAERADGPASSLTVGALTVDLANRKVTLGEMPVALTPTEYEILVLLMRNGDRIVTHHELLSAIWDDNDCGLMPTLRMHMSNLRRKLHANCPDCEYIETLPRIGFRFNLE